MRREHLSFRGEVIVDRLADRVRFANRRPLHARLTEGIERALRHGRRGQVCLRSLVFELAQAAAAADVSRDEVRLVLAEFITDHPLCSRLDRVCLFDGRRVSERLVAQVAEWVDVAYSRQSQQTVDRTA